MFTQLTVILAYLLAAFLMGLVLGWLLWRFGRSKELTSMADEMNYWKQRLEQSRFDSDIDQDRMTVLETERDSLKRSPRSA